MIFLEVARDCGAVIPAKWLRCCKYACMRRGTDYSLVKLTVCLRDWNA